MPSKNFPKQQHYVPRFLLKGFTFGKHDQIHVFDKRTGLVFTANIRNVATQNAFYNMDFEGRPVSLESSLADLETRAGPVIKRIRRDESLASLNQEDRMVLALFVVVQQFRTQSFRDLFAEMNRDMAERLRDLGLDPSTVRNFKELDDEQVKTFSLRMTASAHELAPFILDKTWVLLKNETPMPFYVSDNPVALQNMQDMGGFGNLGLAVPGIEIYLPLNSQVSLAMLCPSHEERLRVGIREAEWLAERTPRTMKALELARGKAHDFVNAIATGTAIRYTVDNVTNHNALQVRQAERYLFCEKDDFALARQMLTDDAGVRVGPRIRIG